MAFLSPRQMIDNLNIIKHSTVIDIGAGSGAYVYEACRVNGEGGKIIAVDIDEEKLKLVRDTAKMGGYNVEILLADIEKGIIMPEYSADYVVFANTLHQIEVSKRVEVMKDIARILVPRGAMLLVEWKGTSSLGPDKELIVKEEEIKSLISASGLIIQEELDAGDYHYAYILTK